MKFKTREEYEAWKGERQKSLMQPSKINNSQGIVIRAGWICFVLGIFLMFLSLGLFFLYAPLFLASFILSIIGMTRGHVASGIFLLIVSIAGPLLGFIGSFSYHFAHVMQEQKNQRTSILSKINFEDVVGYKEDYYMYLEGKVRNNGTSAIQYIKVGVAWLDENETILDTDWTYAIGGEKLRPGQAKSFKIMTPIDHRMSKFRYYIITE